MTTIERAGELMREWGVTCDCSWTTGDHAPECAIEIQWANAMETAADERDEALEGDEPSDADPYDGDGEDHLDGDLATGLASAGFGTDEDYGCFGDDGGW